MKKILASGLLALSTHVAHAEYEQVNLTVFGMDCAPCAHAIHVSMKGIQGGNTVNVDLNTGLVSIKLTPGNSAAMRQFNEAVEKNGFTQKDASIIVRGQLSGSSPLFCFRACIYPCPKRFICNPALAVKLQ